MKFKPSIPISVLALSPKGDLLRGKGADENRAAPQWWNLTPRQVMHFRKEHVFP